jgi:hypothetical protein
MAKEMDTSILKLGHLFEVRFVESQAKMVRALLHDAPVLVASLTRECSFSEANGGPACATPLYANPVPLS